MRTDVAIVGAGPIGLFAVFQLGLFGIRCRVLDSFDRPGGQCAALYADKPIYDIPAWPVITAQGLVDRLLDQIAPFDPAIDLGRKVERVERSQEGGFRVSGGDWIAEATAVVIATGAGAFVGRGPTTPAIESAALAEWGVAMSDGGAAVDAEAFRTPVAGLFAIGDAAAYPGKLKLILSGFHEAALMTQAVRRIVQPSARPGLPYTSSSTLLQKRLGIGGSRRP
jgi:thioredoxin reductase (NADPH)